MGIYGGPYVIRDSSLVLELDAADINSYVGSGTVWNDLTGNSFNATMTGTIAYSGSFPGYFGYISGSNNYFRGNSNLTGSVINGVTIMSWVSMRDISKRGFVFNKYSTGSLPGYILEIGTVPGSWTNIIRFFARGTSAVASSDYRSANNVISQNTIINVSVTYDYASKITAIYLNGIPLSGSQVGGVQSSVDSDWYKSVVFFSMGSLRESGGVGDYDSPMNQYNLIVYSRALSQAEILQNYNAQKSRFGL